MPDSKEAKLHGIKYFVTKLLKSDATAQGLCTPFKVPRPFMTKVGKYVIALVNSDHYVPSTMYNASEDISIGPNFNTLEFRGAPRPNSSSCREPAVAPTQGLASLA